ncbi:Molybdopterin-synthase adenylyltransferase [Suttonella ornithocola]|uniref:Molybdopterin-synthase adenylyltransferase n=2 Tax=Suttonella ornithocola TaxID=279832 RepID=A0A380MZV1_9GAMM|nr:tRNA threonylcarbamoyladenosine dehydratase [Suttonella ornithocola]SUO97842.1 Molybdopterin-synthase adenylyltransferase [Suttonella ornithocola]
MPHLHARTDILLGEETRRLLSQRTVFIAGLGGVGGAAAESIVRAGIGHVILLDHDVVSPSNINRQLLALHSTIGQKKTSVAKARFEDICPEVKITVLDQFLHADSAEELLAPYSPDFLLDCIDSIGCKAALVKAAQSRGIPVISAMGAGNALDVSKVRIARLDRTEVCPLAREMRKHMKRLRGKQNYPVVYSNEQRRQALPHTPVGGKEGEPSGRPRAVNGTISYLPGLFGMMMAGYVIEQLVKKIEQEKKSSSI